MLFIYKTQFSLYVMTSGIYMLMDSYVIESTATLMDELWDNFRIPILGHYCLITPPKNSNELEIKAATENSAGCGTKSL